MIKRLSGCVLIGCVGILVLAGAVVAVGFVLPDVLSVDEPAEPESFAREHDASTVAGSGLVILDIGAADLAVESAPVGTPLRLGGDFDASMYRFEESFEEAPTGWRYAVRLRPRRGWLSLLDTDGDRTPALRLTVPAGLPFELVADLGASEADIELGALAVRAVDLGLGAGRCTLSFDRPLDEPMRELTVESGVGELSILRLGNASPAVVGIRHGVGEVSIDLTGGWRRDSDIRLDFGLGQGRLVVPNDVAVVVDEEEIGIGAIDGRITSRSDLSPDVPRLTIQASGGIGELRFDEPETPPVDPQI